MRNTLEISVEKFEDPRTTIIRCRGDIDSHTCDRLEAAVARLLKEGFIRIVVDLGRVPYMSSIGMGVLIGSKREAEERGGGFVLLNPDRSLKEIFHVMGFDRTFLIVHSDREALQYFGAGAAARGAGGAG